MKIAMWSGPRNLSTAMMYSFAARGDCAVWDEPFYAPYLKATGANHPMAAEIMAAHETDPEAVAARCSGSIPAENPHFYMKHMPHHMVDGFPMDWARDCVNVFLIRHPARVVASYARKLEGPSLADIGFVQQADLYDRIAAWQGKPPVVIDSDDIRNDPKGMMQALCDTIGLPWTEQMLHWPAGGHPEDGVWAAHWYGAVHRSTGFDGAEGPLPDLPGAYADLAKAALPSYRRLARARLVPENRG
jgi:hypothetical protein